MQNASRTYLDYAASTPLDPRVGSAMEKVASLTGNASSMHEEGRALRAVVDTARGEVARLLAVSDAEIVFTSGATEANAAAIRGTLRAIRRAHLGRVLRVAVSGVEHASVLGTVRAAEEDGDCAVDVLQPGKDGVISAEIVAMNITPDTALVVVQWANNVLGTVHPIGVIAHKVAAERARRSSLKDPLPILLVCDAVQALRTETVHPGALGVDILTLSAHKVYGPKGVGAMRIAPGTPFSPYGGGGGHESGRRHGTENVAGIVGLGEASAILAAERAADRTHAETLRAALLRAIGVQAPHVSVVGAEGVPGIVFLRHPKMPGDELALRLDLAGFAVSAGSACDAGHRKAPRALGTVLDEQSALQGGIRVSFGRGVQESDIQAFAEALAKI